MAVKI